MPRSCPHPVPESIIKHTKLTPWVHASELRQAQIIIQRLQTLLMQYAIPVGPETYQVQNAMATIEMVGRPPFGQSLQAQMPIFDHTAPAPHISTNKIAKTSAQPSLFPASATVPDGSTSLPDGSTMDVLATPSTASDLPSASSDMPLTQLGAPPQPAGSSMSPVRPQSIISPTTTSPTSPLKSPEGDLSSTQTAINFILCLEHPCLYHHNIPSVPMLAHGYVGTGHSLMMSSPIMHHSPHTYSLNPLTSTNGHRGIGWPRNATWEVPAIELEKLLKFSDDVTSLLAEDGVATEITPVQAWHRIVKHPNFAERMTEEKLSALQTRLRAKVKCVGFGAIIEMGVFERELASVLGSS
jgi:hypothetical protein